MSTDKNDVHRNPCVDENDPFQGQKREDEENPVFDTGNRDEPGTLGWASRILNVNTGFRDTQGHLSRSWTIDLKKETETWNPERQKKENKNRYTHYIHLRKNPRPTYNHHQSKRDRKVARTLTLFRTNRVRSDGTPLKSDKKYF